MKLNGGPKQYMPLPQSQSDEDENSFLKQSKVSLETEKNGIANGCLKKVDNKETCNNEDKQPMSTLRKIFFVFSVFLCVFFIILFIWIIPCQLPIASVGLVSKDWSLLLNELDSVTTLLLASHPLLPHAILIMGFKDRQNNISGLMAVDSITGQHIWTNYLHDVPIYGRFGEINVNDDNIPDCLILGDSGLLYVINVTNGHELWYFHDHNRISPPSISLPPVSFPSCENRSVSDLIGIISNEALQPCIVAINSSTGCQKSDPLPVTVCDGEIIAMNQWINNISSLIFHCRDKNGDVNIWSLPQDVFCHLNQTNVNWRKLYSLKNANNIIVKPVEKYIVVAWDDGNVILLNETDVKWKLSYNFSKLRDIFDGYFTSNKLEIALVTQDYNGTHSISIIDFDSGNLSWSKTFSESKIVLAQKITNILPKSDGILLKLNSQSLPFNEKFANTTFLHLPNSTSDNILSNINILNESYALLMCWKSFSFMPLLQNSVLTKCESQCWPNMHLSDNTGITTPDKEGSVRLLTVTSTLVPTNFSFIYQSTLTSTTFQFLQCSMR